MSENDLTTISLTKGTRDRIRTYGKKGETYTQILNRSMDELYIRSDGFYLIQFDIGASVFGKIDVLVKNGVPTRAIMDMGSIPEWKREKLYELAESDSLDTGSDLTYEEAEALYSISSAVDNSEDLEFQKNCVSGSKKLHGLMKRMKGNKEGE